MLILFLPNVDTVLSGWVNLVDVRVNDLVTGRGAELFFGEDGMEAEGRCTLNGAGCFLAFSNHSNYFIFSNFSYPGTYFLQWLCNFSA